MIKRGLVTVLAVALLLGVVRCQTYSSVQDAVNRLPELSLLKAQVSKLSLASQLADPNWSGTVFAPVNSALQPLSDAFGGDITSVLGNPQQVNDFFSASVIPGRAAGLADLTNGAALTTLNGGTVTITVKTVAGGKVISVNKARIIKCCIPAGKGMIHEVAALVAPAEYQSMLDMVVPADAGSNTPTAVWVSATPSPSPASPKPSPLPSPKPAVPSPSPVPASSASPSPNSPSSPSPSDPSGASSPAPSDSPAPDATDGSPSPAPTTDGATDTSTTSDPATGMDSASGGPMPSPVASPSPDAATPEAAQYSSSAASTAATLMLVPLLVAALL